MALFSNSWYKNSNTSWGLYNAEDKGVYPITVQGGDKVAVYACRFFLLASQLSIFAVACQLYFKPELEKLALGLLIASFVMTLLAMFVSLKIKSLYLNNSPSSGSSGSLSTGLLYAFLALLMTGILLGLHQEKALGI